MEPTPPPARPVEQPVMATAIQPVPVAAAPRRSLLSRVLTAFLLLIIVASLLFNFLFLSLLGLASLGSWDTDGKVQEKYFSHSKTATNKVAILDIEGVIMSGEGFFKRQIDHALQDSKDGNLKALVVRVNSPGGTVSGSDYMYHNLRELAQKTGIPIVVSMGALAASGGYYTSMAVGETPDTIFAEPTTWTGSIGVIIPHYNLTALMKNWGVENDSMASHPLKQMGSFTKPMTEEERKIFQDLIKDGFDRFKTVIQYGRPKFKQNPDALDKVATGQIFTSEQALQTGLIDKIGFIEDAIDRAIALAKLDKDSVKVVRYKPETSLSSLFFGSESARRPNLDLAALLDVASPKAYYLCTWLEPNAVKPDTFIGH